MGQQKRKGAKQCSSEYHHAVLWIKRFADDCGDAPPDRDPDSRVIPACFTKRAVYKTYKEEIQLQDLKCLSEGQFLRAWRQELPKIKISENTRFTKCGICTLIKDIKNSTKDKDLKNKMSLIRKLHNEQQMGERAKYKVHQTKARNNPDRYASIIIDGMDQNKTSLPHFFTLSKEYSSEFVKTHITGVLSHGCRKAFYVVDLHETPHDSNLTMSILSYVFMRIAKDGVLPPVLYVQMDNCWRENKNQFLLAFFAFLVLKRIVKKVRLSYLLVGHTHEDIDSTFSNISTTLNKKDVFTIDHLLQTIKESFQKQNTSVSLLKYVFNYRDWFMPNIRTPSHHTEPHAYKFELVNEEVDLSFKRFAMDPEWTQLKPALLSHLPTGPIPLVRFSWRKQLPVDEIEEKIQSCSVKLPHQSMIWWGNFTDNLRKEQICQRTTQGETSI
ncbi:uncharacterized protein [Clytia hemisphaerica]|uniref:uncharacterized protein n=1 Tax=Clytia hemisphaerica TaxID=252671 RepID=UPI0034D5F8D3